MCISGGESSGGYSQATIDKLKKSLHALQQNQNLQNRKILDEFILMNLTRVELGDHRKLLLMLNLTVVQHQHIYGEKFTYFKRSRNLMVSLTDISAKLACV